VRRLRAVPASHLLVALLCVGLVLPLAERVTSALLALGAAALAACAVFFRSGRVALLGAALLVAGWWLGSLRLEALDRSTLAREIGRVSQARLVVTGPARSSPFQVRVPVRVLRFGVESADERARLDLPRGRAPPQGAVLEAVVEVRRPRGPDPDGFDESSYLRRQGIHVVLSARDYRIVGRRGGIGGVSDSLRAFVSRGLAPDVEGERRAVIAGIILGEDEGIAPELRDSFRASGLYHLLAVSGQNVAYVVAGAILAAWLLGFPRLVGEVGALIAIAAYVLAVGWQPSVVRAGVAGALASLAWLCARGRDRWYFLLLGAVVLLAWSPYSLLDAGFQLSFAAVAAIFVLVPRLDARLEGYPVPARLAPVVTVSAACGAVTAPILMAHFGKVPLYSIPSNALAAPAVAPILGLALACSVLHPLFPSAAAALAWVNGWLAAYLAAVARLFGGLPHAQVASWKALLALAGIAALGVLLARLPPPRGRRAVVLALALALVLLGWALRPETAREPPKGLRISFLDVGQGDGALIEVPEGAILVDEGPPEAHVDEQLRRIGVRNLAAIVLTHPQRDHVGGAADVLRHERVGFVLDPGIRSQSEDERAALAAARARRVRVVLARSGETFRLGRLVLRVLWPEQEAPPGQDPNDSAVVILASYGAIDALFTADAESNVTLPLDLPAVEILKVAHHGSEDDGLAALLDVLRPTVAVISVGKDNDYGHPAPSTLATLDGFPSLSLYRTDEDGRVTLESDGSRIVVRTEF
jgi:competence protein ComEC